MVEHNEANGAAREDGALLREYAATGSEAAFAELVQRRIGLVYSVALRQVHGDVHRAEDATQAVFAGVKPPGADLASVLSTYQMVTGAKVVADPVLAQMNPRMDIAGLSGTRPELGQRLREVLQQQGVVLETAADGTWVARMGAGK